MYLCTRNLKINLQVMNVIKKWLPDVLVVLLFVVIGYAYFFPADMEGRILYRHDSSAGVGAGQEQGEYLQRTGERTRWTNAIFSGMPTYQMAPSYESVGTLSTAINAYHLWLPENVWLLFVYLLGFYILLRAFDFRWYLAALGSIMWAFSTYFLIIIAAGHIWKVMALAYLPPMIAGIVLAYRGKYLAGLVVTAIFSAFEVNANHVQMTYYYLFIILFMIIAFLVEAIQQRKFVRFLKATGVCIVGGALGILINISNLYHTWEYGNESMRGKSELVKKDTGNQTNSGLERDYITQWSYGIGETWTLLIPNTKGGASVPIAENETAMKKARQEFVPIYQQLGQYWGEQPGTQGPVYVGAFVLFLFVLGLFILKGPMKWALLAATLLSIMLSWGKNFMGMTDFFLDNVPMYAKFRAVASILVIAEFTIPLLAMLTLKKIVDEPEILTRKIKFVYTSFALTGGFALLFALMPGEFFGSFVSTSEMEALSKFPSDQLQPLLANLTEMRKAMFTSDAWRSFIIILIGVFCLLLFKARKMSAGLLVSLLVVLCLFDLWQVNKRYLNDGMFVEKVVREQKQPMTETDQKILEDKSLDYRVLNLASSTFNENETSYYHKSIGGYNAAKLRRYQELIEAHIAPEMQRGFSAIAEAGGDMTRVKGDSIYPVLNMLNAKYFILPLQSGKTIPVENPYVYGNAWFVNDVQFVDNANAELDALSKLDLRHVAVADVKFREQLKPVDGAASDDSTSVVSIIAYEPNHLTYDVKSDKGGVIVFSEIYYPGWTATVDGELVEVGRVNYVLRAITVKPGNHKVELMFYPKSLDITETIAYVAIGILVLIIILAVFLSFRRKRP